MSPLLKGLIIGFSIAAPVGPIGLLCIRQSVTAGRVAGFVSGLGAATADAAYGMVAALGLTAVTNMLLEHQSWLRLGGGVFLLFLGVTTLRAKPPSSEASSTRTENLWAIYVSTLGLTLTNPMTVLSFVGIFAGLGIDASADGPGPAAMLVSGVFLGSATWWLLLSTTAGWLGARLQRGRLRIVNVASGMIIGAFGGWQLLTLMRTARW
jgi:threonine/homoserine/homoserine lactone efflux protein